jgi:mannose-6-phosphate isomerase-like protein (cupin superfamily)
MKGFKMNIEAAAVGNDNFRKVLYTSKYSQLVLMSLQPNEEIGEEVHAENDQFFRVESGRGRCIIDGTRYELNAGDAIVIPASSKHNVINTDSVAALKMYTIYSPAHHKDGITRKTKKDAENNSAEFDGVTTE